GLSLVARGRLYPAVTPAGFDAWRVGPLDPPDRRFLAELAAAFPTAAHALALPAPGAIRLRSPAHLVLAAWDALADTLARTAAAPLLLPAAPQPGAPVAFASGEPVAVAHLRPWLAEAAGGLDGAGGAEVALRVEVLGPEEEAPARAVIQLTSRAEASLVVDAEELYASPAAVIARFGADAEADLLVALRRVARAWAPAAALLRQRAPTSIELDEEQLTELLADGARLLQGTGVALLWPAELLADGLKLHASVVTAPGKVVEGGFSLDQLVEFRWQATLDGELLSEEEIDALAEAKRGLVRLRGRFVALDPAILDKLRARRARRLSAAEALGALLAGSLVLDGEEVPLSAEGPLAELAARLRALAGGGERRLEPPPGLAGDVELRPYQARGVGWLEAMTSAGIGGCLADDMGLGKTLQLIALHLHRVAAGRGPTLVVCPTSLLGNWEREVRRFAPGTAVRRYHGGSRRIDDLEDDVIVVTSYGVARRDAAALAAAGFGLVVADEAQHAKNPESATARSLRTIGGPVRLALTGTPVENRLSELWSILDWTTPGLLGPFERFIRDVAGPIERNGDPLLTERLARTIRPFVLRRRKTDPGVAPDLPARTVSDVPVPLSPEQVTLYEAEVREAMAKIEGEDGLARQALVLRLLTVLKQICNHPAQYLHQSGPLAGRSGKLAALEELLGVILSEGESVLVFSQFVECLALVEARLADLGVSSLFLHGKVPAKRRGELVDAFQAGRAPVMLLSLKAGGVGLNLTRATHVVHYDRWWNPAVEEQATDRAHRIGQHRPVQVHRLIAEGTLEDRIAELIEKKRSLAEAVVGAGESWIGKLSNAELADLVRLGSGS
ncbi:MAG TPA: DEAD/DEAH box helicase, partial [Acidimicrobiales bacterium]|nr:DEAD/DEAH box helicase [Acidimicrobiales bacterium]